MTATSSAASPALGAGIAARPQIVVFDLGAVVFEWQPLRLLARELPRHAAEPQAARRLAELFFQGYGGEWGEFDRGTIELPALAAGIARRTGLTEPEVLRVVHGLPGELQPMAASLALMQELKAAGHRLFYLSNMPAPYTAQLESHDFFAWFEDGVFSSHVRLKKPERAIFDHAVQRFGVAPADCVFLDDHPANVEGARAAGWRALQFIDAPQAREALRALSIL